MIRIDLEKFLDTATVDEYIKTETPGTPITWLKSFWAKYVVDETGNPMPDAEAVLGSLTLRQFRELRMEGELRDVAIPLESPGG